MGITRASRTEARSVRKARVRRHVKGTDSKPRLCVFRSLKFTYAQLVSDASGKILCSASTRDIAAEGKSKKSVESAKALGQKLAQLAKEKSIESVVFDRNGYIFHGRVKAVADAAREAGLKF